MNALIQQQLAKRRTYKPTTAHSTHHCASSIHGTEVVVVVLNRHAYTKHILYAPLYSLARLLSNACLILCFRFSLSLSLIHLGTCCQLEWGNNLWNNRNELGRSPIHLHTHSSRSIRPYILIGPLSPSPNSLWPVDHNGNAHYLGLCQPKYGTSQLFGVIIAVWYDDQ